MTEEHRFSAFGHDAFGRWAERAARFFGTPQYIIGQTIAVVIWIVLNSLALIRHWDRTRSSSSTSPSRRRRRTQPR